MTNETVSQQDELCRKLVQEVVAACRGALTIKDICERVHARDDVTVRQVPAALIRRTIIALEAEEVLDTDQVGTSQRVYFTAGRRVRTGVRWISAHATPPMPAMPARSWCAGLEAHV